MRVGARRAQRRLSKQRIWWLCPAACRLDSGTGRSRSRRPSPAKIWTAPGTSAYAIRVSLDGKNDAPWTPVRVGMSGLLGGGTQ